jgi:hypothetical protein
MECGSADVVGCQRQVLRGVAVVDGHREDVSRGGEGFGARSLPCARHCFSAVVRVPQRRHER